MPKILSRKPENEVLTIDDIGNHLRKCIRYEMKDDARLLIKGALAMLEHTGKIDGSAVSHDRDNSRIEVYVRIVPYGRIENTIIDL